jgi:hypothetical protein
MENEVNPNQEKTTEENPASPAPETPSAPVAPAIAPKKTERLNVDDMTEEDKGMLEVDWGNDKKDDLLNGPKKPVPEQPKTTSVQPGTPPAQPISNEKFKFGISVVVMVVDFILSNVLARIAGDGEKATSYTADKDGRVTFEESLCLLLDTKKDLIPTWLIVLLAFASAWGFQIMAAIQIRNQKTKPVTEKKQNSNEPSKPGLFIGTDGKPYRRYANGSIRLAQFNSDGTERIVGQPARRKAA